MKRHILIVLTPAIVCVTIIAKWFFTWLERELNYIAMGGR